MYKLTIHLNELKAAAIFASRDSTRYVLNCVCLSLKAGRSPVFYATDGRRIVAILSSTTLDEGTAPEEGIKVLIPLSLISRARSIKTGKKGPRLVRLCIEPLATTLKQFSSRFSVTFDDGEQSITGKSVDENFPAASKILCPRGYKIIEGQFIVSPSFIGDIEAARRLLCGNVYSGVRLSWTDKNEIVAQIPSWPNFFSIIMPIRLSDESGKIVNIEPPAWAQVT